MSAQFPSDQRIEARIGVWDTVAGENPSAHELIDAAEEILDGDVNSTPAQLRRTVRYIWRRQKFPHGHEWKRAEELCERAREEVQR
jgi:hypothetical protein